MYNNTFIENWEAVNKKQTLIQLTTGFEFIVNATVAQVVDGFNKRGDGALIQDAFPPTLFNAQEREAIKTGMPFETQKEIFHRNYKKNGELKT